MGNSGYYIYNETEVRMGGFRRKGDVDPTVMWLRHYGNWVELKWMRERVEGINRWQVDKELAICERKMDYWYKMAGWNLAEATKGAVVAKAMWKIELPDRWLKR